MKNQPIAPTGCRFILVREADGIDGDRITRRADAFDALCDAAGKLHRGTIDEYHGETAEEAVDDLLRAVAEFSTPLVPEASAPRLRKVGGA